MVNFKEWDGFEGRLWKEEINVRDFIQNNYTPYDGDESFLGDQPKQPISFGASCRSCRRRNVQRAVSLIWTRILYRL